MHYQIYQDAAKKWRWRLISGSRIIADSGQGYSSKDNVLRGIKRVKESYTASIRDKSLKGR